MTDRTVSFNDLPGVPEDAIIAITSNEPTPEDPLHVRHLKRIAARSVQVKTFWPNENVFSITILIYFFIERHMDVFYNNIDILY